MYFWKCWRDSAVWFFFVLVIQIPFVFLTMKDHGPNSAPPGDALLTIVEAWRELGFGMGIVGCILGMKKVIANSVVAGSDDFLLTRPRSRSYFIWTAWGVGAAEILAIVTSMSLLVGAILYQEDGPFWRSLPSKAIINRQAMRVDIPLLLASVLVIALFGYSGSYLATVLTRGRSPALFFFVFFWYESARNVGWIHVPSLLVRPYFPVDAHEFAGAYRSGIYELVVLAICALACPFVTQLIFERADI